MERVVLVTGASGFVGGHLALGLARAGFAVRAVTGDRDAPFEVAAAARSCVRCDLTDPRSSEAIFDGCDAAAVVHAAALADSARCEAEPGIAERVNVDGTRNLLSALEARAPSARLVNLSTDSVFDGSSAPPRGFAELDATAPRSVYARTKVRAEELVRESRAVATTVRLALVYGSPVGGRAGFLGWLVVNLRRGARTTVFMDEMRTPVFAPDIASAIARIIRDERAPEPLYHLGGRERVSRYDLALELCTVLHLPADRIDPVHRSDIPMVPPRPPDVSLCSERICARYDLERRTIREGLMLIAPSLLPCS